MQSAVPQTAIKCVYARQLYVLQQNDTFECVTDQLFSFAIMPPW